MAAGAGAGAGTAGPLSLRVWPGNMTVLGPRPLAASTPPALTLKRAAMEPTVSPATTRYVDGLGAGAGTTLRTVTVLAGDFTAALVGALAAVFVAGLAAGFAGAFACAVVAGAAATALA